MKIQIDKEAEEFLMRRLYKKADAHVYLCEFPKEDRLSLALVIIPKDNTELSTILKFEVMQ